MTNKLNLGETGRLRLYKDPPVTIRMAIFDSFPVSLRQAISQAPILLSVSYFDKLIKNGMSEEAVVARCVAKCRRIAKRLRKEGVQP